MVMILMVDSDHWQYSMARHILLGNNMKAPLKTIWLNKTSWYDDLLLELHDHPLQP